MSQANQYLERIAAIQATIAVPGLPIPMILQAEPYQPSDMSSVSAPFFVNGVSIAQGNPSDLPIANGQQYRTINLDMALAVARAEAGTDLKYTVSETLQWIDAVYAMFAKHIRLSKPVVNILASTNTSPIQITTTTPHELNPAGENVTIAGHLINTNANGIWNATIIDPNNFTIPTAGNGIGAQTGTAVATQPVDFAGTLVDAIITNWILTRWPYGSTEWAALIFRLRMREMYVQTALS